MAHILQGGEFNPAELRTAQQGLDKPHVIFQGVDWGSEILVRLETGPDDPNAVLAVITREELEAAHVLFRPLPPERNSV